MSALNTQLAHRINASAEGEFFNLLDTVNPSLYRAAAITDLLEIVGEVADFGSMAPNTLYRAAQAIRFELLDAEALLKAYEAARKQEAKS